MKVGVNGRNDFWGRAFTESDYQAIRAAKIELVKMFSFTDPDVYRRLRDENPFMDFIVRLYDEGAHGTPDEFVNRHTPRIAELQPFSHKFEILNEPNYSGWGWGPTLEDARVFNDWYIAVVDRLRARLPWIEPGFPGLSPKMLPTDRTRWAEVAADPNNNAPLDVTFAPQEVRYIRMEQTGRSDRWWWSIHEVKIKGINQRGMV